MSAIAMAKGDGISGVYELEIGGGQVILKGDARSFQAANDFKSRLASLCTSANLNEVKSRPDGSVSFSFRGTLLEGTK
jgi:general secretion pathway protein L